MKINKLEKNLIEFDNGSRIVFYHYGDCCSFAYADCENIKATNHECLPYDKVDFAEEPKINKVSKIGFEIEAINGMKYLVECYSGSGSGWFYGNDLELFLIKPNGEKISYGQIENKWIG